MWIVATDLDIDLDIAMIFTALAPSILIVVTYFFSKKKVEERHSDNKSDLSIIKDLVNGRLEAANKRLEEANKSLEEANRKISTLENQLEATK